jgi:hypothetical protein
MVVCAVTYEPVSIGNSLVTGKFTGNFAISRLLEIGSQLKKAVPQGLFAKLPKKTNRVDFANIRDRNRDIRVIRPKDQGQEGLMV